MLMLLRLPIKFALNKRVELATRGPRLAIEVLEDGGQTETGSSRAGLESLPLGIQERERRSLVASPMLL